MQELESILQERDENDSGLDSSLLFYSGAMAPLNFKPASTSPNKLISDSLLDYISELLKPYGVSSSAIKPGPVDWEEIDLACKAAKEWSKEFAVPSLPIAPKVEMDYGAKAWDDAIYKLNLSAPSSPINPFKTKASTYEEEKPAFRMPGFEPPKTDFSWLKPAEPIMPDFNMHNPGWGAKQNIKTNASSWNQPAFEIPKYKMPELPSWKPEIPKLPSFEPLKFKMPEADLSPLFRLREREKPFGLIDPQPFQTGYDLPGIGAQLHLHGPNKNIITEGRMYDYNHNLLKKEISGYESSLLALTADKLKFKKFSKLMEFEK